MIDRLLDVFRRFHERDVKYVVIGGIAAVIHGVPRATFDLDILIEATPGNVQQLLSAMQEAGLGTATLTTVQAVLAHEVTIFKDRVRIDVQTSTPGIEFGSAWSRRMTVRFRRQDIHVLCREDLIASKRASDRPVDREDVRLLELGSQSSPPRDDGGAP